LEADSVEFTEFLDRVEEIMRRKPPVSTDGTSLDGELMDDDLNNFHDIRCGETTSQRLKALVLKRQKELSTGLTPDKLPGFELYPKYIQLHDMAREGIKPFMKSTFTPNQARGDYARSPQYRRFEQVIMKHLRKLQDKRRIIILPKEEIEGMMGAHISALHATPDAGGAKWRICVDATESGLNEGTDMEAMTEYLGDFNMATLKHVARLVHRASGREGGVMHKTDVSQAFNNMLLAPETALLHMFQVENYAVIPVVSGFGWAGAPAHYNLISGAIDWAHNGGVLPGVIEKWMEEQGDTQVPRPPVQQWQRTGRSVTYVDDSIGQSSAESCDRDMADMKTVITRLMGPQAYNVEKTEGPSEVMTALGWECDVTKATVTPSTKGRCKMYYWIFRGLAAERVRIKDMQKAVGVLRWYSTVIPMASTRELQGALTRAEAIQAAYPRRAVQMCNITSAVRREVDWWKWLLVMHLAQERLSSPAWFLAKLQEEREQVTIFTDASTSIGGGYIWHGQSYGTMRWSPAEKEMFGANDKETDINGLELITAICAVLVEREELRGKAVHLRVDNTAAVAWLNKARTTHVWGQAWLRMLVATLIHYDILLHSSHIPGEENVYADMLSRDIQTPLLDEALTGLRCKQPLSAESRESIWAMPLTGHSPEEYLAVLSAREEWDSDRSRGCVKMYSAGHTRI
jgi:hypothetical protein